MKNNHKNKGSFISFLIQYYIGFTLAVAILILSVFFSYLLVEEGILKVPKVDRLIRQAELLKTGDYDSVKAAGLLGKKGYFEVLDEEGRVIYSSSREYHNSYTMSEIACMQEYYSNKTFSSIENSNRQGKKRYLVTELDYSDQAFRYEESEFALLDESFRILDCSNGWDYHITTEKEYHYLTQTGQGPFEIQKYEFVNDQKEKIILIIHTEKPSDAAYEKLTEISSFLIPVFLFLYLILIAVFIIWLNRKVKKPLVLLNGAMLDFADGYRDAPVEYHGPEEFVQICESFNKMSLRLQESEAARQKLDEGRQKMLADISHDLKTPITIIQGYSKALAEGMIPKEKQERYLNVIYHKSNGLTDLINTFYDYSRLEHPDFTLNQEDTDLCEYCREYIADKYEEIEMADFSIELSIPEYSIVCPIDRIQFRRAIENILANALKHNPPGTTVFFSMKAPSDRRQAVLTVGDNGKGIPGEMTDTIFKPFTVGDESRNNRQGSGLGLAIAKKIVDAHHGTIMLVIPPEGGMKTEFKIKLPL